jgi:hypothetical protein
VILPTGTGKSFIAFKWVEDNPDGRFVWLSPPRISLGNWVFTRRVEDMKLRNSGVDPMTNTRFRRLQELGIRWEDITSDAASSTVRHEIVRHRMIAAAT